MLILDENFRRHLEAFASELFKYTFNLHSDEYSVFLYIWLLYTVYVAFLILKITILWYILPPWNKISHIVV